jgi:hypothetical protein
VLQEAHRREIEAMAPLMVATLATLKALPEDIFKARLRDLFPLMTKLIRCPSATVQMQVSLSDVFAARVGPMM